MEPNSIWNALPCLKPIVAILGILLIVLIGSALHHVWPDRQHNRRLAAWFRAHPEYYPPQGYASAEQRRLAQLDAPPQSDEGADDPDAQVVLYPNLTKRRVSRPKRMPPYDSNPFSE